MLKKKAFKSEKTMLTNTVDSIAKESGKRRK
jgi:hypothetical protein